MAYELSHPLLKGPDFIQRSLNSIDEATKLASINNGKLFGEFVKNVIIPRMKDPKCDIAYSQVNIWFVNQTNADNFVNKMKLLGGKVTIKDDLIHVQQYDYLVTNILLAHYIVEISDILVIDYPSDNYMCYYLDAVKTISITDIIPKHVDELNVGRYFFSYRENALKSERETLTRQIMGNFDTYQNYTKHCQIMFDNFSNFGNQQRIENDIRNIDAQAILDSLVYEGDMNKVD